MALTKEKEEELKQLAKMKTRPAPISRTAAPTDLITRTLEVTRSTPALVEKRATTAKTTADNKAKAEAKAKREVAPPQLNLGLSEREIADRKYRGEYWTAKEREAAVRANEAILSNFFSSMVAPPMSNDFAWRNPGHVQSVLRQTATALPSAIVDGGSAVLGFNAPSLVLSVLEGARSGLSTAGNAASRVGQAVVLGGRAVKPVVTSKPWLASQLALATPFAAAAAPSAGDGSSGGLSPIWFVAGPALAGAAGYGIYRGVKAMTPKAGKAFGLPRYVALWERNPVSLAERVGYNQLVQEYNSAVIAARNGNRTALDGMLTRFKVAPQKQIKSGRKMIDNPNYEEELRLAETKLGQMISTKSYPRSETPLIYPARSNNWRLVRNGLRTASYAGLAGGLGYGIYNGSLSSNAEEYDPVTDPNIETTSSLDGELPTTLPVIVAPDVNNLYLSPQLELSSQLEDERLDSLESVARGVPYVKKKP